MVEPFPEAPAERRETHRQTSRNLAYTALRVAVFGNETFLHGSPYEPIFRGLQRVRYGPPRVSAII